MAEEKPKKTIYTSALKVIYTIFLGGIIALFFGLGVAAFYPGPTQPVQPAELTIIEGKGCNLTESEKAQQLKFENDQRKYQDDFKLYSRNVSIITMIMAVVAVAVGLLFLNKILLLSDGLLLGGVFTLAYSIVRGLLSENVQYRFVVVAVGLLVTLVLGYIKFIKKER
jgi:hypothetical protein